MAEQLAGTAKLDRILGSLWSSEVKRHVFILCVLTGIVTGLYLNSLRNDFVNWDDPGLIVANSQIRSLDWSNIREIFTLRQASTYQPIRVLSYAIDYHFWELNPLGYHITNIIFYLLTCIMVFLTTSELLGFLRPGKTPESNARVAFFTALLFAVHPVHVESVTWLSARKEVLLGFFFFGSLYCYFRAVRSPEKSRRIRYYGLAMLSFVLAVLSKPVGVVLPVVIMVFEISQGGDWRESLSRKSFWLVPGLLLSLLATYILFRVMHEAGGLQPYRGGGFLSNTFVAFYLFILSIKLMALTINFSPLYIVSLPYPVMGVEMVLFALLNLGLIGLAVFMFKRNRVIFFAVLWFYITMLPYSNIVPISTLLADRYVFLASFAFSLVLALGLERLWSVGLSKRVSRDFFPSLSLGLLIFLVSGYGYMTIFQNSVWRNSFRLWSTVLAQDPRNTTAMNSLGVLYLRKGMTDEAFELFKKAVEVNPINPLAHNNLGTVYQGLGEYAESERHYTRALQLKPDFYQARLNLGTLLALEKDFDKAIGFFQALVADYPRDSLLHYRFGRIYEMAGRLEEAVKEYERAIDLAPHSIDPYERLGRLYLEKLNNREKALYFFRKGVEMAPNARGAEALRAEIRRLPGQAL